MRIISGILKGRVIKGYDIDGTRPTMDRVKESIFSSIQNYIPDSVVLDLFAGSGNLGFEAISNYANKCYFVDKNKKCTDMINENIKLFKIDNASVITSDYKDALIKLKDTKFDIVFLDPPYKNNDYIDYSIKFLVDNNMLNKNGIIICEYDNSIIADYDSLEIIKEKKYGDKFVLIFKNKL